MAELAAEQLAGSRLLLGARPPRSLGRRMCRANRDGPAEQKSSLSSQCNMQLLPAPGKEPRQQGFGWIETGGSCTPWRRFEPASQPELLICGQCPRGGARLVLCPTGHASLPKRSWVHADSRNCEKAESRPPFFRQWDFEAARLILDPASWELDVCDEFTVSQALEACGLEVTNTTSTAHFFFRFPSAPVQIH